MVIGVDLGGDRDGREADDPVGGLLARSKVAKRGEQIVTVELRNT